MEKVNASHESGRGKDKKKLRAEQKKNRKELEEKIKALKYQIDDVSEKDTVEHLAKLEEFTRRVEDAVKNKETKNELVREIDALGLQIVALRTEALIQQERERTEKLKSQKETISFLSQQYQEYADKAADLNLENAIDGLEKFENIMEKIQPQLGKEIIKQDKIDTLTELLEGVIELVDDEIDGKNRFIEKRKSTVETMKAKLEGLEKFITNYKGVLDNEKEVELKIATYRGRLNALLEDSELYASKSFVQNTIIIIEKEIGDFVEGIVKNEEANVETVGFFKIAWDKVSDLQNELLDKERAQAKKREIVIKAIKKRILEMQEKIKEQLEVLSALEKNKILSDQTVFYTEKNGSEIKLVRVFEILNDINFNNLIKQVDPKVNDKGETDKKFRGYLNYIDDIKEAVGKVFEQNKELIEKMFEKAEEIDAKNSTDQSPNKKVRKTTKRTVGKRPDFSSATLFKSRMKKTPDLENLTKKQLKERKITQEIQEIEAQFNPFKEKMERLDKFPSLHNEEILLDDNNKIKFKNFLAKINQINFNLLLSNNLEKLNENGELEEKDQKKYDENIKYLKFILQQLIDIFENNGLIKQALAKAEEIDKKRKVSEERKDSKSGNHDKQQPESGSDKQGDRQSETSTTSDAQRNNKEDEFDGTKEFEEIDQLVAKIKEKLKKEVQDKKLGDLKYKIVKEYKLGKDEKTVQEKTAHGNGEFTFSFHFNSIRNEMSEVWKKYKKLSEQRTNSESTLENKAKFDAHKDYIEKCQKILEQMDDDLDSRGKALEEIAGDEKLQESRSNHLDKLQEEIGELKTLLNRIKLADGYGNIGNDLEELEKEAEGVNRNAQDIINNEDSSKESKAIYQEWIRTADIQSGTVQRIIYQLNEKFMDLLEEETEEDD
ncbi:MAG: hypothetical protein ABH832_02275, partial [bacterium]